MKKPNAQRKASQKANRRHKAMARLMRAAFTGTKLSVWKYNSWNNATYVLKEYTNSGVYTVYSFSTYSFTEGRLTVSMGVEVEDAIAFIKEDKIPRGLE